MAREFRCAVVEIYTDIFFKKGASFNADNQRIPLVKARCSVEVFLSTVTTE